MRKHYSISWGVGNRHWRLPDGVHLCIFYSTIPAVAPLTLDCFYSCSRTYSGWFARFRILQGSRGTKPSSDDCILPVTGLSLLLAVLKCEHTHTHALPGKGWFPRWGGHDPGSQGKARSLFGPHTAASLLTQSLVLTCLFPCTLPPKRGTKPEIWGLQHESSAVIQNPSWRIHTQLLTCLSYRSALPASSPLRSR